MRATQMACHAQQVQLLGLWSQARLAYEVNKDEGAGSGGVGRLVKHRSPQS
jgi:hypothetical protein